MVRKHVQPHRLPGVLICLALFPFDGGVQPLRFTPANCPEADWGLQIFVFCAMQWLTFSTAADAAHTLRHSWAILINGITLSALQLFPFG